MAVLHTIYPRLYSDQPPPLQTKADDIPTLIVSWSCTIFALVAILIRVLGRWVRTESLFREDKIMFWSIIPLVIRMIFVHIILIWGTNNTTTAGLTPEDIRHREIGSRLVLVARIFYAIFIWLAKLSVVEFLRKLIGRSWHKSYEVGARIIYGFLAITFIAVVIATLAECRPFDNYWQVVPDPGPQCREGLAQLITMGVCDIVSDVALIAFPIPLVLMSTMSLKRKVSLVLLFLLSVILIAITAFRVPSTIHLKGRQQYRSLLASCEILAASGVSNAVVIGSFIRDRGVKKTRFRHSSISEDGGTLNRVPTRAMSMAQHHWGSDEDLGRELGISVPPELRHSSIVEQLPRPAPFTTTIADDVIEEVPETPDQVGIDRSWDFHKGSIPKAPPSVADSSGISATKDLKIKSGKKPRFDLPDTEDEDEDEDGPKSPGKMFFSDVGGLIGGQDPATQPSDSGDRVVSRRNLSAPEDRSGGFKRSSYHAQQPQSAINVKAMDSEKLGQVSHGAPTQTGPDSLSFTDAGGLLR